MNADFPTQLIEAMNHVFGDRHKLVIVLGDFNAGKTRVFKEVVAEMNGAYLNLNLALTERLLALPRSQYADGVTVNGIIDSLCDEAAPNKRPLFVDNIEILFSPELGKVNPVDTFKRVARQRVVALALPARRQGGYAEYSQVGRADHMLMPLEEFTVLELKAS